MIKNLKKLLYDVSIYFKDHNSSTSGQHRNTRQES